MIDPILAQASTYPHSTVWIVIDLDRESRLELRNAETTTRHQPNGDGHLQRALITEQVERRNLQVTSDDATAPPASSAG